MFNRTITLNTEDGNFSVSMILYKDPHFEDMWTTVPLLTLEDNIFVKVKMVPGVIDFLIKLGTEMVQKKQTISRFIKKELQIISCQKWFQIKGA